MIFAGEDVSVVGSATERENVRMFKKKKLLRRFTRAKPLDGLLLQREPVRISDLPKPTGFADSAGMSYLRGHKQFARLSAAVRQPVGAATEAAPTC